MSDPMLFALAVLAVLATPGPTNTLLATSGALAGVTRSLPLIAAELAGYALSIGILKSLGEPLFATHPTLAVAMRLVLFGYLLLVAWRLWGGPSLRAERPVTAIRIFIATALNPKGAIFAFLVFPDVLDAGQTFVHAALFAAISIPVALAWLALGAGIGGIALGGRELLISRVAAVPLVLFALIAGGPAALSLM
jgi:threonine/homoserine/homoserine lactone efflux protein